LRAGHFALAPGLALLVPFGSLDAQASQSDVAGPSLALTLDLGLGISRTTMLGLWGHGSSLSTVDDCSGCSASTFAGGAFVRYHLVQGLRFDPWMSAGIGVRSTKLDTDTSARYTGVDWLRLEVGGDWYPWSNIGFGPFLSFHLGSTLSGPSENESSGPYGYLLLGARAVLDFPGK
jgi:hypothetical protein